MLDPAPVTDRDRNRDVRESVHEVRGAVQGIDDPLEIAGPMRAAFLGEDGVVGIALADGVDDPPLRDPVDLGDEIVRRLLRDGERIEAVDAACDDVARLSGGADGDVQEWVVGHGSVTGKGPAL